MQGTSKEVRGKQLLLLCWQVQPQLLLLLLLLPAHGLLR